MRLPRADTRQIILRLRRLLMRAPKPVRILMGCLLMLGGVFGFLPLLGFWMLPLGVMVLAIDVPWIRRRWRRFLVRWEKRRRRKAQEAHARAAG